MYKERNLHKENFAFADKFFDVSDSDERRARRVIDIHIIDIHDVYIYRFPWFTASFPVDNTSNLATSLFPRRSTRMKSSRPSRRRVFCAR